MTLRFLVEVRSDGDEIGTYLVNAGSEGRAQDVAIAHAAGLLEATSTPVHPYEIEELDYDLELDDD